MTEWMIVLLLITFGIVFLVLEIIVVPGTTVVGFIGGFLILAGVIMSFRFYGNTVGWLTTGTSAICTSATLYYAFQTGFWKRFASKSTIHSKVNEDELNGLAIGEEGIAISALRPVGKAEVRGKIYEVRTMGDYLETGKRIRIVDIDSNQVIVKQIN